MEYHLFNLAPIYSSISQVLEELDFLEHLKYAKCMQIDFCREIHTTLSGFITQGLISAIKGTLFKQILPFDGGNWGKTECSRQESF
jgi:hypothetical protein